MDSHAPGWLACLVVALCVGPAGAGDRDVAEFLLKKAGKACRAKQYEQAAADFKRARAEFTPLPEAAFGLGQALERLEREAEAIAAYRLCVEEVAAEIKPSPKWKSLARRASTAIARLRRQFAELDRINQDFINDCLKFGRSHLKSDPRWARVAFETVLKLDPTHQEARRRVDKTPVAATPANKTPSSKGWGTALIRGDDLDGWSPGIRAPWSCTEGVVTADVPGRDGKINWDDETRLSGRYELRVKMRVVRNGGPGRTFGLFLGDGSSYWHCFLIEDDNDMVLVEFREGQNRHIKDSILRRFSADKWNVLRLEIDHGEVSVYFNRKKLFDYTADDRKAFDGKIALFAQNGRIEFKELEVRR